MTVEWRCFLIIVIAQPALKTTPFECSHLQTYALSFNAKLEFLNFQKEPIVNI